jgi:predicted nucleic acid-binding protein
MIIDTDVLIWYMRGNVKAKKTIDKLDSFYISVVTYMELVQGMRNKIELSSMRQFMRAHKVQVLYITEEISTKAMIYVEQNYLSSSMQLADALIAATATSNGLPILTANDKHYKVIKELEINKFRP